MMALEWISLTRYLKFNFLLYYLHFWFVYWYYFWHFFSFADSSTWLHNCFGNPATGWGSDCNLYKCPTAISGIGVSPVTTVVCLACHFVLRRSPNSYPWSHRPPCTYMWDLVLKPSDAPPRDGTPPGGWFHGGPASQELRLQSPRISSERRGPSFTF